MFVAFLNFCFFPVCVSKRTQRFKVVNHSLFFFFFLIPVFAGTCADGLKVGVPCESAVL